MICTEMIGRNTDWKTLEPEIRQERVNETVKDDMTAFYRAIKSDVCDKTLKLLLERGANPDIRTKSGTNRARHFKRTSKRNHRTI